MQLMRILSNTGSLGAKNSNNPYEEVKGGNQENGRDEDQEMGDEDQSRTYDEFAEIQF